jgi:CelD/BcsL family acetyltransferase involved in cellulose biosynthesis
MLREVQVELAPMPAVAGLASEWRDLEERSDCSFFVSWSWIACWIDSLDGAVDLRLLRARLDGRTVGLGLLAPCRERRHGLIVSRTLRLHATGRPEFDTLTIECNGFLVERGLYEPVVARMLDHLVDADRTWDELVLDGLWQLPPWPLAGAHSLRRRVRVDVNHYVDLAEVRARNGDYVGLLGSKTRSRIRRSGKEFERFGAFGVRPAADSTQALAFLDGLKSLHQRHWVARGQPGAFANPFFERFHRRLVGNAFGRGEIQVLAIDAGAQRLGYFYNFVHRGRVYNYQSGLDYGLCDRYNQPGLVGHARAIEFNAHCGHCVYDFLAGDVQYKQRLGTAVGAMSWMTLQRDRLLFRVENAARELRDRLHFRFKPTDAAED